MNKAWTYYAIAAGLTLSLTGCSSSSEVDSGNAPESTSTTAEAYSEPGCLTATPDDTFVGGVTRYISPISGGITGYHSPSSYSNAHCYKAAVVRVTDWANSVEDVEIAGDPFQDAPNDQATCEARWLGAIMYLTNGTGPYSKTRTANGEWVFNGIHAGSGYCKLPKVVFGGFSTRPDDVDSIAAGYTYQFAVTYRTANTSHAATLPFTMFTPRMTCGAPGQACCPTVGMECGQTATTPYSCGAGTCQACGQEGQQPCGTASAPYCGGASHLLTPSQNTCVKCGDANQPCCAPQQGNACGSGLTCGGGICKSPPPCGGQSQACCAGSACVAGLMCQSGNTCRPPPACGGTGQQCCSGNACNSGLACQSGTCSTPVVVGCGGLNQLCCNGVSCNAGTGFVCKTPTGGGQNRCFGANTMCGAPNQFCCNDSGRSAGYCDDQTWPGTTCDGFHCIQQ